MIKVFQVKLSEIYRQWHYSIADILDDSTGQDDPRHRDLATDITDVVKLKHLIGSCGYAGMMLPGEVLEEMESYDGRKEPYVLIITRCDKPFLVLTDTEIAY